jgi:hypothetical protein
MSRDGWAKVGLASRDVKPRDELRTHQPRGHRDADGGVDGERDQAATGSCACGPTVGVAFREFTDGARS